MVQSLPWKVHNNSSKLERTWFYQSQKVHQCDHKSLLFEPYVESVLYISPISLILSSTHVLTPKKSLSMRFFKHFVYNSCFYPVTCPTHSSCFHCPESEQYRFKDSHYVSFLFSHAASCLCGHSVLFWNINIVVSSLNVKDQVTHPYKITNKITLSVL